MLYVEFRVNYGCANNLKFLWRIKWSGEIIAAGLREQEDRLIIDIN